MRTINVIQNGVVEKLMSDPDLNNMSIGTQYNLDMSCLVNGHVIREIGLPEPVCICCGRAKEELTWGYIRESV